MDIGTLIGIGISFVGIITGYLWEHGVLAALIQKSALAIVFGGTIGAVVLSFPTYELAKIPQAIKMIFMNKKINEVEIIIKMADFSEKARKNGLLSLEQDAQEDKNDFVRKGLALVVDGIDAETIKDIMVRETELKESIYESAAKIFEAAGGFGPTMGVLGTVMGMVSILGSMEENPGGLGSMIATAFIATMYGVASANVLWLPFASRIKSKAERERMVNDLVIEGLLSIQAGESSRIIKEKLNLTLMESMGNKKTKPQAAMDGKTVED